MNICGNECPTGCKINILLIFLFFYFNLDEPDKTTKICKNPKYIIIKQFDDFKGWEDGSFSKSCELYRYPPRKYYYEGSAVNLKFLFIRNLIDWKWHL